VKEVRIQDLTPAPLLLFGRALSLHAEGEPSFHGKCLERLIVPCEMLVIGERHRFVGTARAASKDPSERLGAFRGRRLEEHSGERAEGDGVDADAQREGQYRTADESGVRVQNSTNTFLDDTAGMALDDTAGMAVPVR